MNQKEKQALLSELARAKVLFQTRSLLEAMGVEIKQQRESENGN